MEITPVSRNMDLSVPLAPLVASDKQAEQREIIQEVKAVNGAQMLGSENELMFQFDRNSQRMVVRVVNRQTGDLVSQVPPEYVLRLAEDARGK